MDIQNNEVLDGAKRVAKTLRDSKAGQWVRKNGVKTLLSVGLSLLIRGDIDGADIVTENVGE